MAVLLTAHSAEETARRIMLLLLTMKKSPQRYAVLMQDSNTRSTSHIDKKFEKALTILFSSI